MSIVSTRQAGLAGFTKYRSLADASGNPVYYPPSFDFITSSTFSAVSSVSIDNCFSADYDHYLIMRNLQGAVTDKRAIRVRLRASGSDNSSTQYRSQRLVGASTTVSGERVTGANAWAIALGETYTAAAQGMSMLYISNPFNAARTTGWHNTAFLIDGDISTYSYVLANDAATSYDGFTAFPESNTITGSIYVYGWKV